MVPNIKIGTAGWSYKDWNLKVYPKGLKPSERLAYMAGLFDAIEINSTFYAIPAPEVVKKWVVQVENNRGFLFTCKTVHSLTHEKKYSHETAELFLHAVSPLMEAQKLGAVLVQFPWYFDFTDNNFDRIKRIAADLAELPLVLELRHSSFLKGEFLSFIEKNKIGIANIDLPSSRTTPPPSSFNYGQIAYFRFHGRNSKAWFDPGAGRDQKFNYCYSEQELKPWTERIKELALKTKAIFVITNNHYQGKAVANAFDIAKLLGDYPGIPETIKESFPHLV